MSSMKIFERLTEQLRNHDDQSAKVLAASLSGACDFAPVPCSDPGQLLQAAVDKAYSLGLEISKTADLRAMASRLASEMVACHSTDGQLMGFMVADLDAASDVCGPGALTS